ncbi:hypothetical protein PIROE2DRAFT_4127 [Piromyces sp. E2]|nr:hypothetical protein PIROE2DRAFT_4127 [Piromyces sp. E2]|eukprot:OUM68247.1 hypothetical protein PIROE2DRAFT_4127 [Piromyces sp. E2]
MNNKESSNDFNEDIIRPNFHTNSRLSKNLSLNSKTNFMSNFSFDISNDVKIEKYDNNSIMNNKFNVHSGLLDNCSPEDDIVNSFNNIENTKKEIQNNERKKRKKLESTKVSKGKEINSSKKSKTKNNKSFFNESNDYNIEMSSSFKKKTNKKNNSFGDNVSKNYRTLKLKRRHKDISGPRYMKFRNHSNISYSYDSAIMTNYCILNNENPYSQDLLYMMNSNDFFDIDLNKILNFNTKEYTVNTKSINMESEFVVNDDIKKLNYNNYKSITIDLKKALSNMCNFSDFKKGQLEIIKNVLNFKSSLLILQTGGGKSLCYQLPSYIYKSLNIPNLTLVISPTISLMQDQLFCLPKTLEGALFVNSLTVSEQKQIIQQLINKKIDILFITPERLHSENFQELLKSFPPINFVCIDEVHCLSEWSHNFRPSYLYLNQILRNILNIKCILGLTGSLTNETQANIIKMLNIPKENVVSGNLVRNNIRLTISQDSDR